MRQLIILGTALAIAGCGGSPAEPGALQSVIVVGTPPAIGLISQFTALAVRTDGATEPLTSGVTWRSSNPAVATVKDDGTVTGVSRGSVEISATARGARGGLTFDVTSGPAFRLSGTVFESVVFRRMAAVTVVARDASGATLTVITDSNGNYAIAGVAAGAIEVTARADGYIPNTMSAQISGDTTLNFTLGRVSACPTLGFDDLATQRNGVPFTTWSGCGFTVTATSPIWSVSTSNGRPAPFVQFMSPLGVTTSAEIAVTAAGGAKFRFQSLDVYSASTAVFYSMTGIGDGAAAFVVQNTVGAAFGTSFTTVRSAETAATPIDALLIRLTNPSGTCCATGNPMGLDNIVVVR